MYGLCTFLVRVYFYSVGRNTERMFSGWVWVTVRADFYSISRMAIYYVTIHIMSCMVGILNICSVGGWLQYMRIFPLRVEWPYVTIYNPMWPYMTLQYDTCEHLFTHWTDVQVCARITVYVYFYSVGKTLNICSVGTIFAMARILLRAQILSLTVRAQILNICSVDRRVGSVVPSGVYGHGWFSRLFKIDGVNRPWLGSVDPTWPGLQWHGRNTLSLHDQRYSVPV